MDLILEIIYSKIHSKRNIKKFFIQIYFYLEIKK